MFRDAYRRKYDAIRPDPSFRRALEDRMEEEMKVMRYGRGNRRAVRRRTIALVAVLALLLAATAVAVVQGSALRTQISEAGGKELASQVQDVHVADATEDFAFSIDEVLWEGDDMFVSYTASVPDDGHVYLVCPYEARLNGDRMALQSGVLFDDFFAGAHVFGGDYEASGSDILKWRDVNGSSGDQFSIKCAFLRAERPVAQLDGEAIHEMMDDSGILPNSDTLYCDQVSERNTAPVVYLSYYPEVRAQIEANIEETARSRGYESADALRSADWEGYNAEEKTSPEELSASGIATLMAERSLCVPVEKSENQEAVLNDVAQRKYEMDGYSIEITQFNISHFYAHVEAIIRSADGGVKEWTQDAPYGEYYGLVNADGTDYGKLSFALGKGGVETLDGEAVYSIGINIDGIFPVEETTEVYLVPEVSNPDGTYAHADMSRAIRLEPIYNPELPAATPEPAPESTQDPAETDDLSA